jgi:hypothetical protein
MFFFAGGLMTEPDDGNAIPKPGSPRGGPAPDGAHYREMALELRKLARQCRFPGARRELLQLAASYDRRADHFDRRAQ